jgi:hypothetical protein
MEMNLNTEAFLIVLETLEHFITFFGATLDNRVPPYPVLDRVVSIYVALFEGTSTKQFITRLYSSLRVFICRFSQHVFKLRTTYCSEFCRLAIRHCSSGDPAVRSNAATFLYLLMKRNLEAEGGKPNFNRVKVQTTIGLSKLVGKGIKSIVTVQHALSTIMRYNELLNGKEVTAEEFARIEEARMRALSPKPVTSEKPAIAEKQPAVPVSPSPPAAATIVVAPPATPSATEGKGDPKVPLMVASTPTKLLAPLPAAPTPATKLSLKRELCHSCGTAVYSIEKLSIDGNPWHKACFRCAACNTQLLSDNYFPVLGRYYCRHHYQQLFMRKGGYVTKPSPARPAAAKSTGAPATTPVKQKGATAEGTPMSKKPEEEQKPEEKATEDTKKPEKESGTEEEKKPETTEKAKEKEKPETAEEKKPEATEDKKIEEEGKKEAKKKKKKKKKAEEKESAT